MMLLIFLTDLFQMTQPDVLIQVLEILKKSRESFKDVFKTLDFSLQIT